MHLKFLLSLKREETLCRHLLLFLASWFVRVDFDGLGSMGSQGAQAKYPDPEQQYISIWGLP